MYLWIWVGSGLGGVLRYFISGASANAFGGTLRQFVMTGICGDYTTFSAFG